MKNTTHLEILFDFLAVRARVGLGLGAALEKGAHHGEGV